MQNTKYERAEGPRSPLAGDLAGPGVRKIARAAGFSYPVARRMIADDELPTFFIAGRRYALLSEIEAVVREAARKAAEARAARAAGHDHPDPPPSGGWRLPPSPRRRSEPEPKATPGRKRRRRRFAVT